MSNTGNRLKEETVNGSEVDSLHLHLLITESGSCDLFDMLGVKERSLSP